ncbi:predicted protein [Sclerotinia sclerotiorum 1980 UF-70]|uniref:Uncharacterized protein n=1 Tax=Sclerotinia sclerotiorum (strain ATCC 18683 / 1980 / Ss-1) TaxID=665079 RepID=A7E9T0_SCLS1|nr:predicted protein [Sclerotinia sclerotiorum 1980 UF-70]EDN97132.1 predicted protein [Sclerotinia sclerotiorum 1980 UF-70]
MLGCATGIRGADYALVDNPCIPGGQQHSSVDVGSPSWQDSREEEMNYYSLFAASALLIGNDEWSPLKNSKKWGLNILPIWVQGSDQMRSYNGAEDSCLEKNSRQMEL